MRVETPDGLPLPAAWGGAGPIAPATAFGVVQGMRACLQEVFGNDTLEDRTVALQGLGVGGWEALLLLGQSGARVIVADIDPEKVKRAQAEFGVRTVPPEEIHRQDVDV